jgi:hypothetical protein
MLLPPLRRNARRSPYRPTPVLPALPVEISFSLEIPNGRPYLARIPYDCGPLKIRAEE